MKITAGRADGFIARLPADIRAVLLYGPDQGAARIHAATLTARIAGDKDDPFRVVAFTGADIRADPARLLDEACALSMSGGRRVIIVREAGDEVAGACADMFAAGQTGALLLLLAGELPARSKLRRLFESEKTGAAVACYPEAGRELRQRIQAAFQTEKIDLDPDGLDYLTDRLAGDRGLLTAEIGKLVLYAGTGGRLTLAEIQTLVATEAEFALGELVLAVGAGRMAAADRSLQGAWQAETAPVTVLRALQRHMQRLASVRAGMNGGKTAEQAMRSLKPPVFWKETRAFQSQAGLWSATALADALAYLLDTERSVKRGAGPDRLLCGRAVIALTQKALTQKQMSFSPSAGYRPLP